MSASVNREQRNLAAHLLEQFMARKISATNMVRDWPRGDDLAVSEIRHFSWFAYDDFVDWYEPSPQRSRFLQNCIDFLRTGLPYEWPVPNKLLLLLSMPLNLVTLGVANRWLWKKYQFPDHWPFLSPRGSTSDQAPASQ
jgi:hypothetical protein